MMLGWALACTGGGNGPTPLHVFAASSLSEAFSAMAPGFEQAHPQWDVHLSFSGSQVLRVQIEHGAAADVFASADSRHMAALLDADFVHKAVPFATNDLALIVPLDNPASIQTFYDLPRARRLVIGTEGVPVGNYARLALRRVGADFAAEVMSKVVSEEANVRLVRAKVTLGVADAALVYKTDVTDDVLWVPIPAELATPMTYPMGIVTDSAHEGGAAQWMAWVLSKEGREALAKHGFGVDP